jgi:hypothetical protein
VIADKDIGGAYVLKRIDLRKDERLIPPQHLAADQVLGIPTADRRALVEGGFLEIHSRRPPPWNPKDEGARAALRAWIRWKLDEADIRQGDTPEYIAFMNALASLPPEARHEAFRKADYRIALDRLRHGEPESLQKLISAQCRESDRGPGRPQQIWPEVAEAVVPPPLSRQRRLRRDRAHKRKQGAQAVATLFRIQRLLANFYKRWRALNDLAMEIAAEREGVSKADLRKALKGGPKRGY